MVLGSIMWNGVNHAGEFYELLVFNEGLNEAERQGLGAYLQGVISHKGDHHQAALRAKDGCTSSLFPTFL